MKKSAIIINVIFLIAIVVLYYLHFAGCRIDSLKSSDKVSAAKIVFVNTDSIWDNYKFVEDKKKELSEYEEKLQNQYDDRVRSFKNEYDSYLKEGTSGKLSLAQQKKREEELAKKQQEIAEYDKSLSSQFLELQHKLNEQIQDSIIGFIKKHNKKYNFNYVLGYSRNSGILFADEKNEITKEILDGLNKQYRK